MVVGFGWDYEVLAGVNLVVKNPKKKGGDSKKDAHAGPPRKRPFCQSMFVRMFCLVVICKCYLYDNYFSSHSSLNWLSSAIHSKSPNENHARIKKEYDV